MGLKVAGVDIVGSLKQIACFPQFAELEQGAGAQGHDAAAIGRGQGVDELQFIQDFLVLAHQQPGLAQQGTEGIPADAEFLGTGEFLLGLSAKAGLEINLAQQ